MKMTTSTIVIIITAVVIIGFLILRYFNKQHQEKPTTESKILIENGKPVLKQFGELTPNDFVKYPVWVQCHVIDYDEKWYDDTDEETFRPWIGDLPVLPDYAMFLVKADMVLKNGNSFTGFITPCLKGDYQHENDLGLIQPQIFTTENKRVGFWTGMFPIKQADIETFYKSMGINPELVFPIKFSANEGLTVGVSSGIINGFLTIDKDRTVTVTK
jgi:hypothetical protein